MSLILGVDIGGTKIAAGVVDDDGEILDRRVCPTPSRKGGSAVIAAVLAVTLSLREANPIHAIGVGSAGVIDPSNGSVLSATDSIADWAGTPLRGLLHEAAGLPVAVCNDVHAHALGEAVHGAGRGHRSMIMMAVGTGLGGAHVVDGAMFTGVHGAAGHFGHIPVDGAEGVVCPCGRTGHLESICSGPALFALYRSLGGDPAVPGAPEILARVEDDPVAADAVARSATALGRVAGGLVNALDADAVVLSGGLGLAADPWWSSMEAALRATTIPLLSEVPALRAELGNDAAIVGAAHHARSVMEGPR
ncbi:ROK family protein [Microbacterium pseudoresistens]|uniref:Glucokinase n=1 Tax=Microbacterium pseudoresistens TaxID=640634 RepID=A0A7Y9ETF9_9MICO|nr:ROK family protein [Microbacterium pseudoresistens]NYD53449.1 glucokinase [Microbacterium pseudoresistens]